MHAQALGRRACPHPTEAEQPVCLTMEGMWPAGGWLDVQSLRPPWGLIWKDFLRESVWILLDIQFLSAPWVCRSLSNCSGQCGSICFPNGEWFFITFKQLFLWTGINTWWAEVFFTWSFQFEFHYFSCLPGEGENTPFKHSFPFFFFLVSQRDAPSCNSVSAAGHICLKYQSPAAVVVAMLPEGEESEKDAYVPFRDGYQLRPHPFSWKGLEVAVGRGRDEKTRWFFFSARIKLRAWSVLSKCSSTEPQLSLITPCVMQQI